MNLVSCRINLLGSLIKARTIKYNFHYSLLKRHLHLQITPRAIEQLKKIAQPGEYLRINVDSGGCAGFEYKILLDKQLNEDDEVMEEDGIMVVVDKVDSLH